MLDGVHLKLFLWHIESVATHSLRLLWYPNLPPWDEGSAQVSPKTMIRIPELVNYLELSLLPQI